MKISLTERVVNWFLRGVIHLVCVVDTEELRKIPMEGPGILASNHTSNLEAPIYYLLLQGREKTALGKIELWGNPVTRFLMNLWNVIPLNRSGPDRKALGLALEALRRGEFLGIAPEGTRSKTGMLQRGRPGAAMLALAADAPIYPLVQWGLEDLPSNLRRFRRTQFHIAVGEPFRVSVHHSNRPAASELRRIADEIMYQLAVLLPEEYRGVYRDLSSMTTEFIVRPAVPPSP